MTRITLWAAWDRKDKAFARGVDRATIERGASEMGIELREHIANVLSSMKNISDELGL